jgi:protein-L-isoaspartate(D-aspartate) O-methyltransferase
MMVREQIENRGITHPAVLRSMRNTPRHLFVPPALREMAYADRPLPIGYGATISQPYIVALMTELLNPAKADKVLEIGTGSGYQAAILAPLVSHVFTIEIVPELARSAAETLKAAGHKNVTVRSGDGYKGWPEEAPFDAIILTAAPPDIPTVLVQQLKAAGRLVAPIGGQDQNQNLILLQKDKNGKVTERPVIPVRFVPMRKGN